MRTSRALLALLPSLVGSVATAQVLSPPSATYLFTTNVHDVRALWINPAGLGILPDASIHGELAADRTTDAWSVRQYTFGLSARNVAVGYQKDRFDTGGSDGRWRVGGAIPLAPRMAIGTAVTFYRPGRSTDVGLRFPAGKALDVGLVLRGIGRPVVDSLQIRLAGVVGIGWRLAGGRAGLTIDAIATERRPLSGYDRTYRTGLLLIPPARTPISLIVAADLESDLAIMRWSVGIALGAQNQMLLVGSAFADGSGPKRLQSFNAALVARGTSRR